jgi:hypothetical protein
MLPIINIGLIFPKDDIISAIMVPTTQAIPIIIKKIPPIKSCFQDIIKIKSKISDGILCINNPINISLKLDAESKTSNEKIAKNNAKKIRKILGIQNKNLFISAIL